MEYLGEHLLPGKLGHFLVVLSFSAALLAVAAYYFATVRKDEAEGRTWCRMGRFAFLVHSLATLGIIGCLFWILTGKMYEYQYAWSNISDDLPMQYVFSAFWKEQQGSFLLWSFWHVLLAGVFIFRSDRWEAPIVLVIALAEVFIGSMLLGLHFGDLRLGASPFDLLRQTMDAPIFETADYLQKIKGNGLNPLLQNYWMTIHPPTLFLGFASTIVPFGFAVAGLWQREHRAWLEPALRWALFSGAVLGTGILMGGAWAYEALSFAGYWAWDPVENTSLVPWLILVAGIHTNLIARATGYSTRSTYAFYLLSFLLVLYSTYLTRSGILGDTSAHAFTEMGLGMQLVAFILFFKLWSLWLWVSRYREVPEPRPEESAGSREFWMFIGALVLFFSSLLITGATSLPVYNKVVQLFKPDFVGTVLEDPVAHHNRYQLWIAVFMGVLTGVGQFMRYRGVGGAAWLRTVGIHLGLAALLSALLTYLNALWIQVQAWQLYVLLFAALFAVVSSMDYLVLVARGNLRLAASAISHFGFGILIVGILSTGLNKTWISSNAFAMEGLIEGMGRGEGEKNILLMKDAPMPIKAGYEALYVADTVVRQTRTFTVRFRQRDASGNFTKDSFTLHPNVMYDRQFSKVVASNPSTQHYWDRDIFTHISSLPKSELDPEFARQQDDSLQFINYAGRIGDTVFTQNNYLIIKDITKKPRHPDYLPEAEDLAFGIQFEVHRPDDSNVYRAMPIMYLRPGKGAFALPAAVGPAQMKIRLTEATMDRIFQTEEALQYRSFSLTEGGSFRFNNCSIRLVKLDRNATHVGYTPQADDIAVGARLEITPDGEAPVTACPLYLIRENRPYSLKDEVAALGLHLRFEQILPQTGTLVIAAAQADNAMRTLPFEVAENATRSDYIVLEAIIFPGINLVWIGSLAMLLGLGLAWWNKNRQRL